MKTELTRAEKVTRPVIALAVALLIWLQAINQETYTVEEHLPLQISIPAGYALLESSADSAAVTYTGSGSSILLFQLGKRPDRIPISFTPAEQGSYPELRATTIPASMLNPGSGVSVTSVHPSEINLRIDTMVSRTVPVSVTFTDGIPARFRFVGAAPGYVTVTGPALEVLLMDSLETVTFDPSTGTGFVSLVPPGEHVAYSSDSVRVTVHAPASPFLVENVSH